MCSVTCALLVYYNTINYLAGFGGIDAQCNMRTLLVYYNPINYLAGFGLLTGSHKHKSTNIPCAVLPNVLNLRPSTKRINKNPATF